MGMSHTLTLLPVHSDRPKLYTILACLSAVGLKFYNKFFLCDAQGSGRGTILYANRSGNDIYVQLNCLAY